MKRRLILALTFILVCALMLPILASCDIGGSKKVWFCREDGDIEYYISFDEKDGEILVVVVDGRDAEAFTLDYEIDDDEIEIKDSTKNKAVFSYKEKSESYVVIDGVKFKITDEGPDDYDDGDREFTVYELLGKLGETVLSGTYVSLNSDGAPATLTFSADGGVTVTIGTEISRGTYELRDGAILITLDGYTEEYSYSYDEGNLTIDGIIYAPMKNSSTTKPQDPSHSNDENQVTTRYPEYTVEPDDDPHYTKPSYTEDENGEKPNVRPETGAIDTSVTSKERFTATYESMDLGDGNRYRWIFQDDETWVLYYMDGNNGEEVDSGKYYFRKSTIVVMSENMNFEVDNFSVGMDFEVQDLPFYFCSHSADYPSDAGNNDDNPGTEKPGFIGTYRAADDDGDAMTYLLVIDGGMYTVYSIDVWGKNASRVDQGKYTEKGNSAIIESSNANGWKGVFIMKSDDIIVYNDIHFNRTSTTPDHPDVDLNGGITWGENGYFYGTFTTAVDKDTKSYIRWIFFIDGTYERTFFERGSSFVIDEGNYKTKDTRVSFTSFDGMYGGKFELYNNEFEYEGERFYLTTNSNDSVVVIPPEAFDSGFFHYGTGTDTPLNDVVIYDKTVTSNSAVKVN